MIKKILVLVIIIVGILILIQQRNNQPKLSGTFLAPESTSNTYDPNEIYNYPLPLSAKFISKAITPQCKTKIEEDRIIEVLQTGCSLIIYHFSSDLSDDELYKLYHDADSLASKNGWNCYGGGGGVYDSEGKLHGGRFPCTKGSYQIEFSLGTPKFSISKSR